MIDLAYHFFFDVAIVLVKILFCIIILFATIFIGGGIFASIAETTGLAEYFRNRK